MPIEIIPAESIWKNKNPEQQWPTHQQKQRLYPIAEPKIKASLKIKADEKIFCIGSCFAVELGKALYRLNYNVLSVFHGLPQSVNRGTEDANMFIKYNVAAIYNELTWALNPSTPYSHDKVLIETSGKRFQDYQLRGHHYTDDLIAVRAFREAFNTAFSQIKDADVVIITLGLSEVWFDKETQLYLNTAIPLDICKRYPNRFEVHVLDYAETAYYLNAIYDLLNTYLKPSFRLLITVSPIPLSFTFRAEDILTANAYSKSVLRTAVEPFLVNKKNVNYFPSYECVTLSHPITAWSEADLRHVDAIFIDYIMANVIEYFTEDPQYKGLSQITKTKALYYRHFNTEAKETLRPLLADKTLMNKEIALLSVALKLGIKNSSQLTQIRGHFKTYRHLSLKNSIANLFKKHRRSKHRRFCGCVEGWRNGQLIGWAIDMKNKQPVKLNILINGKLVDSIIADKPRPDVAETHEGHLYSGFNVTLAVNENKQSKIEVLVAETKQQLEGSPAYEL